MNEAGARETVASAYAKELSAYANGTLAKDLSLGTVYSLDDDSILCLPPSHLGIHTSDTALLATSFLLAILGSAQGDGVEAEVLFGLVADLAMGEVVVGRRSSLCFIIACLSVGCSPASSSLFIRLLCSFFIFLVRSSFDWSCRSVLLV
ncbi:hypothetical protein C8J56DRAFT_511684 [Mycena floridula]|nr:hypothetical protein C8J56DRAFT_511684 [Mycena floridula]